jgi:hypothetical protein
VETSGSFRATALADQLVSVKPIKGPVGLAWAIRRVYSTDDEYEQAWAEQKKQWHMEEIKEAGNDYEI